MPPMPSPSIWRITIDERAEDRDSVAHDASGRAVAEEALPALSRRRAEIAQLLGVSQQALHAVLSERASVTPEMALRLGKLSGNDPELWLALQTRHDIERLRARGSPKSRRIPTLQAA
jgi:addiction module HigA family antidote